MKRTKTASIALSAIALFAFAGCGSSSSSPSDASSGGLTHITVGVLPVPDTAAIYTGVAQGFFKDEGLDVTLQPTTGGADAVPGVVSGNYTFAFGNYVSGFVAADQGLDIKYVANATQASAKGSGFQAVVVPKDSPINSPKDLAGKTVSVNNLQNINDTTIRGVVDADGGDSSTIKFTEVAFPDAVAAVTNHQVDAGTINPWTSDLSSQFKVITYNFTDFTPDLAIAGFFTSGDEISNHPDVVKEFQDAMNKSLDFASKNPDAVKQEITQYTKMTADQLKNFTLPVYSVKVNMDSLHTLADAAQKYGTISKPVDFDSLFDLAGQ